MIIENCFWRNKNKFFFNIIIIDFNNIRVKEICFEWDFKMRGKSLFIYEC